jgi:hypothetical protein
VDLGLFQLRERLDMVAEHQGPVVFRALAARDARRVCRFVWEILVEQRYVTVQGDLTALGREMAHAARHAARDGGLGRAKVTHRQIEPVDPGMPDVDHLPECCWDYAWALPSVDGDLVLDPEGVGGWERVLSGERHA